MIRSTHHPRPANSAIALASLIALFATAMAATVSAQSAQPAQAAQAASPERAAEIVAASRASMKADTMSTRSRLEIIARDGAKTERLLDQYTAISAAAVKTVIIFQKPASVAGTRFLTIQNAGKPEDRWIFLPSLGKVRRVAATEGSGSFMGTDFSYDDVALMSRDPGQDDYAVLSDGDYSGEPCWVIEAKPKNAGFQYSRMVMWIEKSTSSSRRMDLYDRKGELAKQLEILEYRDIQGRRSAVATRMSTMKTKTSTTIYMDIVKYDDPIPASVFTEKFLLTGKP